MLPTFSLLAISQNPTEEWFRALAAADIADIGGIQIREKHLEDRPLWELTRRARAALPPPVKLLVNGRLDVALAAGADGVHLPSDGVPTAAIAGMRARFGADVLIGRSTHRIEEVERARDEGADYVVFGPVYETPGKGPPLGLAALEKATAAGLSVYALGGVTLERFGELAGAGAAGVAAIRLFQDIPGLGEVAQAARETFGRP